MIQDIYMRQLKLKNTLLKTLLNKGLENSEKALMIEYLKQELEDIKKEIERLSQ